MGYDDQKCFSNSWIDVHCWEKNLYLSSIYIWWWTRTLRTKTKRHRQNICKSCVISYAPKVIVIDWIMKAIPLTCKISSLVALGNPSKILSCGSFPWWYLVFEIRRVNSLKTYTINCVIMFFQNKQHRWVKGKNITFIATSDLIIGSVKPRSFISDIDFLKEPYASWALRILFLCFDPDWDSPKVLIALACWESK